MINFNLNNKTNISGKVSMYCALSIIAVIVICTAAWNMLDIAKNTYLHTLKGSKKEMPKEKTAIKQNYGQNFFLRKLFIGFYKALATLENAKD